MIRASLRGPPLPPPMVSRTFPATQCPRTMIFTDYAWPCCSHVHHEPRHARARRRPFEGYACCENKATTAAAPYSNRDFFRVFTRRENTKKRAASRETGSSRSRIRRSTIFFHPSIDEIRFFFFFSFADLEFIEFDRELDDFSSSIETKPSYLKTMYSYVIAVIHNAPLC